uniref:hypothetical protein n=1 Tax=Mycolicibacterium obuense TaxID=1807 RepID=UPI003F58BFE5
MLPYWPSISETDLQSLADDERAMATSVSGYADTVQNEMTKGASLLVGQGGEARVELMRKMVNHADGGARHFKSTATAADSFRAIVVGLKTDLSRVADAAAEAWNTAQSSGGTSAAVSAMAPFKAEAASLYSTALEDIAATPAVFPIPEAPIGETPDAPNKNTAEPASNTEEKQDLGDKEPVRDASDQDAISGDKGDAATNPDDAERLATETGDTQTDILRPAEPTPAASPVGTEMGVPATGMPATALPMGGGSAGGGMPSAGSAMGGLRPPQMPAGLSNPLGSGGKSLSDALTSPASAADSLGSGGSLTSAASSFNSGLASGIGSSGAVSPPPLERFMAQHPGAAPAVAAPAPSPGQPSVAAAGGGSAGPAAGPMVGGGPMMAHPPAAGGSGGGPLAPFVPPGGGAAAGPTAAGPTAPASAAAAPATAAPSGQQGSAAPVMAGTSGAATAASMPEPEVSADLLLARQVIDGLVRGTDAAWNTIDAGFVNWAVAVVRTQLGSQLVIGSSAGGGVYVPASVFVPTTARLAPIDPALPWSWASGFLGWRRPADLLTAHADALSDRVSGVVRSALVTTAEGPRPSGWSDFETVTMRSILHSPGSVPVLDGAHQHRLATIDPALAQQIASVGTGPASISVAAVITRSVVESAVATAGAVGPDGPVRGADGPIHVAEAADLSLLNQLSQGVAVDWDSYDAEVAQRHDGNATSPHMNGPLDLDDSADSLRQRLLYMAFYRTALIAELIRFWRQPASPALADIVYCAVAAGFKPIVTSTLNSI